MSVFRVPKGSWESSPCVTLMPIVSRPAIRVAVGAAPAMVVFTT
jgi:hypothetical protein